jgi:hypothetical protein
MLVLLIIDSTRFNNFLKFILNLIKTKEDQKTSWARGARSLGHCKEKSRRMGEPSSSQALGLGFSGD